MWARSLFLLVTAFFVTMNVLLWRAEFGTRHRVGGSVPVEMVLHKILTAPDMSSLEIRHQGVKIGYGRWVANVGEELATGQIMTEEPPPEGMVKRLSGYTVDVDANFTAGGPHRFRLASDLKLSTNHDWQEFNFKLTLQSNVWEVQSVAATETLRLHVRDEERHLDRTFRYAELRNPERLLRQLGGPLAGDLFGVLGLPVGQAATSPAALGLSWQARHDWLKLGHAQLRVYRLEASLLDRFKAVVLVSRAGEIFRVELPGDILLVNDKLNL
jgi:hypothetical protein